MLFVSLSSSITIGEMTHFTSIIYGTIYHSIISPKGATYPVVGATFFQKLYLSNRIFEICSECSQGRIYPINHMHIFYLEALLLPPGFKDTFSKNWHNSPQSPLQCVGIIYVVQQTVEDPRLQKNDESMHPFTRVKPS